MAQILVVDDSWLTRKSSARVLVELGHEVELAESATQMFDYLNENNPDCIFLDINMPHESGLEALVRMRDKGLQTPVVFVSADTQNSTRSKCLECGAKAVLNKPLNREAANSVLKNIL